MSEKPRLPGSKVRVATVARDENNLRNVIRREGTPAIQDAWDKYERWLWITTKGQDQ